MPGTATSKASVRIAAVGDVHYGKMPGPALQPALGDIGDRADVLLLCGDLTDHGLVDEARGLAKELATVRIPMIGVLGNHDVEAGKQDEVVQILKDAGVRMLDGDSCEIDGVGFAGVKGFCGGFGARALAPWGEDIIKRFVHEAIDEALKLESALMRLTCEQRIVVLHYAPVQATVEGEPCEIMPFLGSSRLEEPLARYPLTAIFHGHAHHGALEGRTRNDVLVYNVARPLLDRLRPDEAGFRIVEIPRPAADCGRETAVAEAPHG